MPTLSVDSILGPHGALQAALGGYEHRPEQIILARAVERALAGREYLLAEAGTGTGKTLAYLIPSVLSGRKVLISTATKTLQEQIFLKDIPLLRDAVGLKFDSAYLKGRSNYLCLERFNAFSTSTQAERRDELRQWPLIEQWATQTQTGDRTELDIPDSSATWRAVSTTPETCLGPKCGLHETCYVTRARRVADAAQIVVVNHHLFFADLAIRASSGEGILPRYEAVIFDEAHKLEDIATQFFGFEISNYRLEELVRDTRRGSLLTGASPLLDGLGLELKQSAQQLFSLLLECLPFRLENESVRIRPSMLRPIESSAANLRRDLENIEAATSTAVEPALGNLARRCQSIATELEFLFQASSPEHVFWAELRGRGLFMRASPIEVARDLQATLYQSVDTAIFTSATLRAEGSFKFALGRLGLEENPEPQIKGASCVAVDSPFNYRQQAALFLPQHLPEPASPDFSGAVAQEIVQLAQITGGRAFALFTSLRNMIQAHAYASKVLPCRVLLQGEKPKATLLDQFRREPSVLFASHSFWEGIDVAGDSLSLVIIDKLPFANPNDPLTAARIEQLRRRGDDPFQKYQMPAAAIALRQGFGRLIRTRQDRGIVAILDPRLSAKGYGKTFLASLPKLWTTSDREALREWFVGKECGFPTDPLKLARHQQTELA